jgi:L-fucose mutarotase/ribose pyranase (RbsD/FucU family)
MEWDDYLRQQAATYRQLAEKAEDAVVKKELLDLADVCEEVANNVEDRLKRVNGMSRFRTRLEGLDFNLHPKKPMAFCSTATETLYGSADRGSP